MSILAKAMTIHKRDSSDTETRSAFRYWNRRFRDKRDLMPIFPGGNLKTNFVRHPSQRFPSPKKAFTLVEMLVAVAVVALLAVLIYVAVSKAIDNSKDAKCISNLRQIGDGIRLYAKDNQNTIVPGFSWKKKVCWNQALEKYLDITEKNGLRSGKDWQCPKAFNSQDTISPRSSYAINVYLSSPSEVGPAGMSFSALPQGRRFVLVADQPMLNNDYISEMNPGHSPDYPKAEYFRHNGKINILWTDFSVSPMSEEELMAASNEPNKSLWRFK